MLSNYPNGFSDGVLVRNIQVAQVPGGRTYYVGNHATILLGEKGASDSANAGTFLAPFGTIDYAIGRCKANRGDIIYVRAGHDTTITGDSGVDQDVAGVSIIGLGNGSDRPTITFTTEVTADYKLAAANSLIHNLLFVCNVASQEMMVEVTADDCEISNCEFRSGTATALNAVTLVGNGAADRTYIHDCKFYSPADTGDSAIAFAEDMTNVVIANNDIYGDYDDAGINIPTAGDAQVNCEIRDNEIVNLASGQHAIQVVNTTSTGRIVRNLCITSSILAVINAGGMEMSDNRWNDFTDQGPDEAFPAADVAISRDNGRGGQYWYVDSSVTGGDGESWGTAYINIQSAVDAADDNDTIKIMGTTAVAQDSDYTENVTITAGKNGIHIQGCGNSSEGVLWTVVSGNDTCLTINGVNALVENIRFRPNGDTGRAIFLAKNLALSSNAAGTIIRNCTFRSTGTDSRAIQSEGANDITVEDCVFKECTYAFYLASSDNSLMYRLKFRRNYIDQNCANGVVVDCVDSFIHDNKFGSIGLTHIINTWATGDINAKQNQIWGNNLSDEEMLDKCVITSTDDYSGEQVVEKGNGRGGKHLYVSAANTTSGLGTSWNTAFTTIQAAVTAAGANDTINIMGTAKTQVSQTNDYTENVTVPTTINGLHIRGTGATPDGVLWSSVAPDDDGTLLTVNGTNALIENIRFRETGTAGTGIFLAKNTGLTENAAGTTIRNCIFRGTGADGYAIRTEGANDITIENCIFKDALWVLYQSTCPDSLTYRLRFKNNYISEDCTNGIGIDCSDSFFHDNKFDAQGLTTIINTCKTGNVDAKYNSIYNNNLTAYQMMEQCTITSTDDYSGEQAVVAAAGNAEGGSVYWVDSGRTISGLGTSPNTAVKTIAEGVALATTGGSTVYVGGEGYSEPQVVMSVGRVSLIAVNKTKESPIWYNSTPASDSHLKISACNCEVSGFRFHHPADARVPAIIIDGENGWSNRIVSNYFTSSSAAQNAGGIGISYQSFDNEFIDNEFFNIQGGGLLRGCIYEIAGMANVPVSNTIHNNRFFQCETCISLSSKWATITGNFFSGMGLNDSQVTGIYINLLHLTSPGDHLQDGSSIDFGGNIVAGNHFADHFSWEINTASGFRFSDTDSVTGNYCKDGIMGRGGPTDGEDAADTQLVPGKTYTFTSASVDLTGGDVLLWTIAGGPIKLTSLGLQIVAATNQDSKVGFTCTPTNGAEQDVTTEGSSGLELNAEDIGNMAWSSLDEGIMLLYDIDSGGIPKVAAGKYQIIPPGTFQLTMQDEDPTTGAADVYIEFMPLGPGVSVTPA